MKKNTAIKSSSVATVFNKYTMKILGNTVNPIKKIKKIIYLAQQSYMFAITSEALEQKPLGWERRVCRSRRTV